MKIGIIAGSHRQNSQSSKVAKFLKKQIELRNGLEANIIDLAGNPFPLWDESIWAKDLTWETLLQEPRQILNGCDAFIVISPEWHGQVPAGLKNFFLLFGKNELGHKPALITAISSGTGGSYPVAELRMSSYKNNRITYLPEHLILKDVEKIFNENLLENDARSHKYLGERFEWCLDMLIGYGLALKNVRATVDVHSDKFGNGM